METEKTPKGWHLVTNSAPHRGIGTATVEPIRKRQDIEKVKYALRRKPQDRALFVFAINTGFRAGDLLSLTWRDLLSDGGTIRQTLPLVESKTKKHRRLPITDNTRKALLALLNTVGGIGEVDLDAPVFASNRGSRLTVQRLHQMVNEWAEAAGVRGHFGTHTLRKTFGYHHHKAGMDIAELMNCFGHSSQAVTLRYIGIQQEEIDRKVMALNL